MSSDDSQSSSLVLQSSCEPSFTEDVSCDGKLCEGRVQYKQKYVDSSEPYDTSVEPLATEEEH